MQVALLDKEHFPRDKYCGDAVCTPAINILREMGVLKELQDNNEAHFADNGGFVSPSGISYIGTSSPQQITPSPPIQIFQGWLPLVTVQRRYNWWHR